LYSGFPLHRKTATINDRWTAARLMITSWQLPRLRGSYTGKQAVLLSLALVLGLEQKSLALAKQVFGLAGLVICQTNNTATMLKSTFIA